MPNIHLYRHWRDRLGGPCPITLTEATEPYAHLHITERFVQALWYDQRVRPDKLRTADEQTIKVLSPGFWNLEAGPDFRRALIQFGNDKATLGDVEVHVSAADWARHGHNRDPLYDDVMLHVILWQAGSDVILRTSLDRPIPQLILQNHLAGSLEELFDAIDPEAYPYDDTLHTGRCARTLAQLPPPARDALLDAAGDERIRAKARKFSRWAERNGLEQALYESIMEALGYKANKQPFRLLAQRLPLKNLPRDPVGLQAALLGLAGFLPKITDRHWDAASRRQAKILWNHWWKMQADFAGLTLDPKLWRFSGLRPQNFPQRRLAAMSVLLIQHPSLAEKCSQIIQRSDQVKIACAELENLFCALNDPFWSRHYRFGSVAKSPVALIGRSRARDIIINVILPAILAWAHSTKNVSLQEKALRLYADFPRLAPNSILQFAAYRFCGPRAPVSKILSSARRQQGLHQLFQDFCLNDSSACSQCRFPELAAHWPK